MSIDDNKDDNFNCSESILVNEGYYIKKDWDEWLEEWNEHHYRNKMSQYIEEHVKNGDKFVTAQVIIDYQNYVMQDASTSEVYLNRESLKRRCINIARAMRKTYEDNNNDLEDFKHDKELIGLKYSNIRTKVNFIQITVIIASTIITFLETMKDKLGLTNSISMTIAPILLSTYIGLALAISRFYKLDDHKEELCKLDEAQSFVISGLRHRMRDIESMKPLYCDQDVDTRKRGEDGNEIEKINPEKLKKMLDYFNIIEKNIEDQRKDGLEETIANCKQKIDLVMNLSERVYYKNILLNIRIDKCIVDSNKKLIHDEKNKNKLRANEDKIKKEKCFLWKYICCFCNDCMYHYIDKTAALQIIGNDPDKEKDIEEGKDNQKTTPLSTVINDTTYHDMGYDTPDEMEEESPKNYLDFNFIEKEFNIKKKMVPLSKLSQRRKKTMFMSCGPTITSPKKNDSNNTDDSELCLNNKETTNISIRETNGNEAIHDTGTGTGTGTGSDISSWLPKEKQDQNKKIKPIDGEEYL